jgi:hypothetical protein
VAELQKATHAGASDEHGRSKRTCSKCSDV